MYKSKKNTYIMMIAQNNIIYYFYVTYKNMF